MFEGLECHMTCLEEGLDMWDEVRIFGEEGLVELRRPLGQPIGWALAWHDKLKRYGDNAEEESARRADQLAADGDDAGVAVWRRIIDAIGQLANTTPPGQVH